MAKNFCANRAGNTGAPKCDPRRGIPVFPILGDREITPAEADAFQAVYEAAVKAATGDDDKLYPFPLIQNVDDQTEAPTEGSLGLGFTEVLREGHVKYQFRVVIGQCLYKALRKFNGYTGHCFIYDNLKQLWGYEKANGNLSGYKVASFFVTGNGFGNGSDPVSATVTIVLESPEEFHDYAAFIPIDFNIGDIKGLQDAELFEAAAHVTNVYKIGIKTACDETNLYDAYSALIASAAVWNLVRLDTGATVSITSVAVDATLKAWTVTADNTAYTALPAGTKLQFKLDDPADLDSADITGIESIALVVTK